MLTSVSNFTEKKLNFTNFVTYKGPMEKSTFLKNVTQAFETGDFLDIFLSFSGF